MTETTHVPSILQEFAQFYGERHTAKPMTIDEYLEEAKANPRMYQSSHAAMVEAFGEPRMLNTREEDPRLSRIYENRILQVFEPFEEEFFGMYDVIQNIYKYLLSGSQGLDAMHKILYLLGPVGGGKSSLVEKLKQLAEKVPMRVLAMVDEKGKTVISPVYESPLGLFSEAGIRTRIAKMFDIPLRAFPRIMSPWANKRLEEAKGDLSHFRVVELLPSIVDQIGIGVATPGDDTNQDTSTLVGKTDIRRLEQFAQNDPDAYSFSGALCVGQRMMEFVEMFKAPIKTLNPLLPATMENYFTGTEQIGAIPFHGVIVAHSNEAEWSSFKTNKRNEAFLDRVSLVQVPYVLAVSDEIRIYEKLVRNSTLRSKPCAPETLRALATFFVSTRVYEDPKSTLLAKLRVYDGDNVKETDLKAKPINEYRTAAGVSEGMTGESTRFAFEVLANTFNFDPAEIAADPVHLLNVLEQMVMQKQFDDEKQKRYIGTFLKDIVYKQVKKAVDQAIHDAYFDAGNEFGQSLYDRYILLAEHWLEDTDCRDPDSGVVLDREEVNKQLEAIEKPAGIGNPKDFRGEVYRHTLRYAAKHDGRMPNWRENEQMRKVLEKKMFENVEEMLPVISFGRKSSKEMEERHNAFVARMVQKGWTENMVRRMVEFSLRTKKN
ncbi:MAG TPA: PrkA family serine protein kinase [Candidatus Paceibacterota bacterium]